MSAESASEPVPKTAPETAAEKPSEPAPAPAASAEAKPAEDPKETPADATTDKPKEAAEAAETAPAPSKDEPAAAEEKKPEAPAKPEYLTKVPGLENFFKSLPAILEKTGHPEMWGVTLKDSNDIPTVNVLIKFLRANEGNVKLAEEQLSKALSWRKEIKPLELAQNAAFSAKKFAGLGYITSYVDPRHGKTVFTWNIYGAVKNASVTFGDADEFIRWRTALMEKGVQELGLNEATEVIDYQGEDRYQMVQVHDYKGLSFLRLDPNVKAATKKTIDVFSTAYPELLREKFFVNVPAIMGWVYGAIKVFLSKATVRKFHPVSNGANLGREFSFEDLPKSYGGKGGELQETARTIPLVDDIPADKPEEAGTEAAKKEAAKEESAKEPAKEEPAKEEPAKEEPAKEGPAVEEPAKEEPAKEEPAKEESAKEEAVKEAPKEESPAEAAKEEPAKEEPAKEEPAKEEPAKEEPAKEEPAKAEETAKEEPAQEEPAKEEAK